MSCDDEHHPLGASKAPLRPPKCRFRTVRRYFEGAMTARCVACKRLVEIDELGDQVISMPCGQTWALSTRAILQRRT
jgi:hypothetical protein